MYSKSPNGSSLSSGSFSPGILLNNSSGENPGSQFTKPALPKEETFRLRKQHLGSPCEIFFSNDPLKIVRGEKQYLFDDKGHQYLDCVNNVAIVGHCHPKITEVAHKQMSKLYTNNRYLHDSLSLYVQRLTQLFPAPLEVCFLCNSGSEANDLAMLLAKAYTDGTEIITLESAYHGHLQSCVAVSPHKYVNGTASKPSYVHVASAPDTYRGTHAKSDHPGHDYALEVKKLIDDIKRDGKKLSSFIMESFQSCGGLVIPPSGYMQETFRYVREAGGVCIADEVQVGFGRVGTHYWAFETQGVVPDIVTLGKPMGNGHPVAGVITTKKIADSLKKIQDSYFNTVLGKSFLFERQPTMFKWFA